jgi:hypothetical protein
LEYITFSLVDRQACGSAAVTGEQSCVTLFSGPSPRAASCRSESIYIPSFDTGNIAQSMTFAYVFRGNVTFFQFPMARPPRKPTLAA